MTNKLIGIAAAATLAIGCSGSSSGSSSTTSGPTSGANGSNSTSGSSGASAGSNGAAGSNGSVGSNGGSTAAAGSAGTTGGGTGSLMGSGSFTVGNALSIFQSLPDGGVDPTVLEVDITDDASDACTVQSINAGFLPDGGVPAALHHVMQVVVVDPGPMGVQLNKAYPSLTVDEWDNQFADGGGQPDGGFAQVIEYTGISDKGIMGALVSVSGTATMTQDMTTMLTDTTFSVDTENVAFGKTGAPTGLSGSPASLTGNANTPSMCGIQFAPQSGG